MSFLVNLVISSWRLLFSVSHLSTIFSNLSSSPWLTFCTLLWASNNLREYQTLKYWRIVNYGSSMKIHLEYLSCHVNNSSVKAANSPFGNFSDSLRKFVSILTMCLSRSINRCFKFSISTCKCRLLWSQAHDYKLQHEFWVVSNWWIILIALE